MTEPGRLRIIGAVLAGALLLFGAATAWQVSEREASADAVYGRSQPLSAEAANIYRHLADANTTAAKGFLAGGKEPRQTREQYRRAIADASLSLAKASATTGGSARARAPLARLNQWLPVYTGLIESARANNRQGLPLGGAYLRYANDVMTDELLAAADELYRTESARLDADYRDARAWPWAAVATGVLALGALGWAQRRDYVRTNRVFNVGTLGATGACAALLLWLLAGHGVARAQLTDSDRHGAQSLRVLNEAQISALQARAAENLTLVARGAVEVADGPHRGKDAYEVRYERQMARLTGGTRGGAAEPGSLLARAGTLADDEAGRAPVARAVGAVRQWQSRHTAALSLSDRGDYDAALNGVIGRTGSTDESFARADRALDEARGHEQREFEEAARGARDAFTGLVVGAGVLAVLGALGAVLGIGRRLSEYR
ncbi:hypothetical protein [Streptomyces pactum]|uniref:hypothetical protein n=1 Tax=Streptomyces pactum TaxID=68249 RepID=UPI0027DB21EC|nr:hypothetical protein [Streptomyces pactum]